MSKKMMAICASLVALAAFAVAPALASGATLTETGSPIATGKKIVATVEAGTTVNLVTSIGTVTCTTGDLTGTVHQNSGGLIKGTISVGTFGGTGTVGTNGQKRCTSTFPFNPQFEVKVENLHYCIENESTTADTFIIEAKNCTEATHGNLRFTLTNAITGACTYEKAQVTGTFNTNVEPATLSVKEQKFTKVAGGGSCPESGTLTGAWTLETDEGEFHPLVIS